MTKPHIQKIRGYWCVFQGRAEYALLVGLTARWGNLHRIGPWRDPEIRCEWFGDAKPS